MDPVKVKSLFAQMSKEDQESFVNELSDEEASGLMTALKQPKSVQAEPSTVDPNVGFDFQPSSGTSYLGETVSNVPSSAARLVSGVYDAVTSPVETGRGLWKAFKGGVKMLPGAVNPNSDPEATQTALAVGQHYKERFGGGENILRTINEDPVGAMLDASLVFGAGGGLLRAAGTGAKSIGAVKTAAGLKQVGGALGTVSKAIDPVQLTAKGVSAVTAPVVRQVIGRTTGSGAEAMAQAQKAKPEFIQAMRGEIDDLGVVEKAREAFGAMKESRAETYRQQLQSVKAATNKIDISPIKASANDWLKKFGVKTTPKGLDFSRSTLSGQAANDVAAIYDDISKWGSKAGDNTPIMLDTLKRRISDFYTENGQARAMVADLSSKVSNTISKHVPEYKTMTKGYEDATKLIKSTEQALLSKNPQAVDTALRKIMMGVREEKGLRRALMDDLSKFSNEDIMAMAAGRVSSPWFTRRLESSIVGAGGVGLGLSVSPQLFALIPMASPRIAAEATQYISRFAKLAAKTPRAAYMVPQQAGSLPVNLPAGQ